MWQMPVLDDDFVALALGLLASASLRVGTSLGTLEVWPRAHLMTCVIDSAHQ